MSIAIIPALMLTLLTTVFVYVLWYIFRGRHSRTVTKKKHEEENNETVQEGQKGRWGVPKDSYCYPAINDILGWEFVHVVQLKDQTVFWEQIAGSEDSGKKRDNRKRNVTAVPVKPGQNAEEAFAGLNRGNEIPDNIGKDEYEPFGKPSGSSKNNDDFNDYETELEWPEYSIENADIELEDDVFDELMNRNYDKIENNLLTEEEKEEQERIKRRMEIMLKESEQFEENKEELIDKISGIDFDSD